MIQGEEGWWDTSLRRKNVTARWKIKLYVSVEAPNKQMGGVLNTRATASVSLALV